MHSKVGRQRQTVWACISVSLLAGLGLWFMLLRLLPAQVSFPPVQTAIACTSVAALLTLLAGIEAVAHERLLTSAIDPLAGIETQRMRVNFRYLSNTVEQFIVFAAGLLALALFASPKTLIITTIVWVLARWAFWIGYHKSPLVRAIGAAGMIQSLLVLLYVSYRFSTQVYGETAGIALVTLFGAIESILWGAVMRRA